jgi:ADP-ribose pyrophosphatase
VFGPAMIPSMKLTAAHRERFIKKMHHHQGNAVGFQIDEIRLPDGKTATREFLTHPGAVGALAFTPKGLILLVKQYRHPIRQFTYEIPAGKLGKGEDPLLCVKRELEEETGFTAGRVKKLTYFWPTGAFSDEVIHLYVADKLVETEAHPDEDEFLEVVAVTPAQMGRMIRTGKIHDSKTMIAYLAWVSGVIKTKR